MRNIIVLVGKAATGKDEVEIQLEKHFNVKRLVSHTSRPKRDGEIDGENYYFTSYENIKKMIDKGETVEHTSYIVGDEKWLYALSKSEINNIPKGYFGVVTVNHHGVKQLTEIDELKDRLVIIYLTSPDSKRKERYFKRDEHNPNTQARWEDRVKQDDVDFMYFENTLIDVLKFEGIPLFKFNNALNYFDNLKALGVLVFKKVDHFTSYEAYIKDSLVELISRESKSKIHDNEFPNIVYDIYINREKVSELDTTKAIIKNYVYLSGDEI